MLWLFRSMTIFSGDSKDFREQKERLRADPEQFIRFRPVDRFRRADHRQPLLLVLTGMPLKFYYTEWAKWLLGLMGGRRWRRYPPRRGLITIFALPSTSARSSSTSGATARSGATRRPAAASAACATSPSAPTRDAEPAGPPRLHRSPEVVLRQGARGRSSTAGPTGRSSTTWRSSGAWRSSA